MARPEYISLLQENCTCSFCTILPGNLPDPRACPLRTKDNLGYQYAVGVGFEQTCPWWEQRSCYNKTRPVLEVYMIYVCWFLYIIWLSFSFLPLRIWSSVVFLREQLYCLVCTIMRKEIMVQLQTYTTQLIYVRCATRKWAKCLIKKLIFNKRLKKGTILYFSVCLLFEAILYLIWWPAEVAMYMYSITLAMKKKPVHYYEKKHYGKKYIILERYDIMIGQTLFRTPVLEVLKDFIEQQQHFKWYNAEGA